MKKLIRKSILLFLCLLCSFDLAFCQNTTDTTLRLNLFPDSSRFYVNLIQEYNRNQKKCAENVKNYWIDGQTFVVTCKNTRDNIDKVKNAAQASAQPSVEIVSEKKEKEPVVAPVVIPKEMYNPEIDLFLNIEDERIFSDAKFMILDKQQIHPRSYKYYCLIRNIYEFGKKLKTVQINGLQQPEQSKIMVDEMSELAEQISSDEYKLERTWLSQKQKDYYNQLYKKYEEIWYIFNK